tara:strand:- start:1843 stop:2817 length:975 start_codon:yes stop_codon:yes gene_type:complete
MKREILKVALYNFLFILLFFIAFESILRIFNLSQIQGYKAELYEDKIHRVKPNSEGIIGGNKFYIDSFGLRIPKKNYKYKSANKILFLGDSVTFGVGVKEEKTFVGLYRKNFRSSEVYNLALFGYQIEDYLVQLDEISKLYPVEKIVYFLTLNDVYDHTNVKTVKYSENMYKKGFKKIFNRDFFRQINHFLRDKSYLYTFLKGVIADPQASWFQNVFNYYEENELDLMKSFFVKFKKISYSENIKSYIFILPYEFQTRNCNLEILMPQIKIKELSKGMRNFYDLTSDFCKYKNPKKLYLKYDPMHLSEEGHNFVYNLTNGIINR